MNLCNFGHVALAAAADSAHFVVIVVLTNFHGLFGNSVEACDMKQRSAVIITYFFGSIK